ncbi:hypothetical protein [Sphingobacterium multivorum]|uniref:hypothetical protein n=1 Tax=Sphingobacterium multivorum TaxID=28454 RepID=UPI003DA303B3
MNKVYIQLIEKYFPGLLLRIMEEINGKSADSPRTYYYRNYLKKVFSVDGRWETITANNTVMKADYVAVNSPLPLKQTGSLGTASGKIPKSGLEMQLNEEQMDVIDTLIALQRPQSLIAAKLLQHLPTVILAVYELIESSFLEGLSNGLVAIADDRNVGTNVRLDFKYRTDHMFGVSKLWSDPTAKPFDDFKRAQDKANTEGKKITKWLLTETDAYNIANTEQAKQLYAFTLGFVGSSIPTPTTEELNKMTKARFGYVFEIIDRTIVSQKNGIDTMYKPWAENSVIGLCTNIVGELVWATVAEDRRRKDGVHYEKPEDFLLVAQFRENRPTLLEIVNSQAKVIPVISAINDIFKIDSSEIQA